MDNNEKTIDFNKEKTKQKKQYVLRKLRFPLLLVLAAAICVCIFFAVGETRRSSISDSLRSISSSFGELAGYPYSESDLSLKNMVLIGDKPLLVTNTGIDVLSPQAEKLQNIHLDWADTKAVSTNGRALIFSNTSNEAYFISRTKILSRFSEAGPVTTGCVAANGCVGLVYNGSNVQSVVKVYNVRQKAEFVWECKRDYVSSVSLSDNGKKIAVSALGVDNTEIYSRIILFETDKHEPEFDVKLSGTSVLSVVLASANKIIAVGDNKTVIFNRKGEIISQTEYSDEALFAVDRDKSGSVLLCYKEFGGSRVKFVSIPPTGKKNKEFYVDYLPSSVDIGHNKIAIAIDNTVSVCSFNGSVKKKYDCKTNVSSVMITSTGVYTVENGTIHKY